MAEEGEIFEFLTISMARIAGTGLLSIYYYNRARMLVSRSALGILLIVLSFILVHIAVQKKYSSDPLVVLLCVTVSSLWSNSGIIQILVDHKIFSASEQLRETQYPGLVAFCCAFLIIGCVGVLQNKGVFPLLSFALGLGNIHILALYNNPAIGPSGIGCNFMIVTIISLYLVADRFANMYAGMKELPVEKKVSYPNRISRNHLVVCGILANILSSSILCGKIIGTTKVLFSGQANWMFTSAAYQVIVSIASFWARDILHATFFSLLAMLKIVEGYSLLNQPHVAGEQLLPCPFMVMFAILFFALFIMMSLQNIFIGVYTLLFTVYCATLTLPSGINHKAAQVLNVIIFLASVAYMASRLYLTKTDFRVSKRTGLLEMINACLRVMRVKSRIVMHHPYSPTLNTRDVDTIGHAFNALASFSMAVQAQGTFILVMASGCMVHKAGLMSLYTSKAAQSSAFIFYGVLWVMWGFAKYIALQVPVRAFYIAVGIICFLAFNSFFLVCMTTLNIAWFLNSVALEVLLIMGLLNTLGVVPDACVVVFSVLFGAVSFYCFMASLVNGTLVEPHLPWGKPLLKHTRTQHSFTLQPLPAKKLTSIKNIAELMKSGGICVLPVDRGYAVASSCYFSDTVQKLSQLKIESEDEISVFISSCNLKEDKSVLGRRLQGLMQGLRPNPVGFVLPKKGNWLSSLKLEKSSSFFGSPKNMTLYITDCEVTTQIINHVGPLAVRLLGRGSQMALDMKYANFPGKVDGILLDEVQKEDFTFTILDCTGLEKGTVNIIKEGSVPRTQVTDVLHTVIAREENCSGMELSVSL